MLKKILLTMIVLLGGVSIYIALQPDTFQVTRSIVIDAPASAVFPAINDMRVNDEWSPWAKIDPNAKITLSGPPMGVGATYYWSGNDEVGEGEMKTVESRDNEMVKR